LEKEYKQLDKLKEEIEIYNLNNPNKPLIISNDKVPEGEILRICQQNNFNFKEIIKNIFAYLDFLVNFFPIKITDKIIEILSHTGYIYVHGRDRNHRPILIVRAEGYLSNQSNYTLEEWLNATAYFYGYVIRYILIPGQVENWNMIGDIYNISLLGIPSDYVKIIKFTQANYRCRLNKAFVFGMNIFLDLAWKILKSFLNETVQKKVNFVNNNNMQKVFDLILPEQLEIKYGGKAKNLFESVKGKNALNTLNVDCIFPPNFPDSPNQTKEDLELLIKEEEYYDLYRTNMLKKISPYFDYKKLHHKYNNNNNNDYNYNGKFNL
jgi:hypothetical protein